MTERKNILITGASSGFGRLTVPLLLARGHRVLAAMRGGEARLREVFDAGLVRQFAGTGALGAIDLHLERPESFAGVRRSVEERWQGALDVLINNAGYGLFGSLEDLSPEQLRRQMEVNFFGPVLLTRELLPCLRARRGRVINVSSVAGRFTFPLYGSYSASKYALEALGEGLYYELKPLGVQVCLLEPGGFRTDFSSRSRELATGALGSDSPYLARTRKLERLFVSSSARLGNPRRVARRLVRLTERGRLPVRSMIGIDAWAMTFLSRILPDNLRVRVVEWFFRRIVFRD